MARYFEEIQAHFTILLFCVAFLATTLGQEGEKAAILGADPLKTESCKMIVEMCTTIYKRKLNGESASDKHVCEMLQDYKLCLERSASTCKGESSYDTLFTVTSRLLHRLC